MISYTGPSLNWGDASNWVGTNLKVNAFEDEQRSQVIRWQGEQDYRTLIDSGVDPEEALRRTAPKLFHNDPRALASAVEGMGRKQERIDAAKQQNEWRKQAQQESWLQRNLASEDTRAAQAERQATALAANDVVRVKALDANGNEVTYPVPAEKYKTNQILELRRLYETEKGKSWLSRSDAKVEEYRKKLVGLGADPEAVSAPSGAPPPPGAKPAASDMGVAPGGLNPLQKAAVAKLRANLTPEDVLGFRKLFGAELTDIALRGTSYVADAKAKVDASRTPSITPNRITGAVPPPTSTPTEAPGNIPEPRLKFAVTNFKSRSFPFNKWHPKKEFPLFVDPREGYIEPSTSPVSGPPDHPLPSQSEIAALRDPNTHEAFALKFGPETLARYLKYIK